MEEDITEIAANVIAQATTQSKPHNSRVQLNVEKNPAAVALGRLGGLKGGKARANSLTSEARSNIAKQAAEARWSKAHTKLNER